jgi:hypothetical protein
MDDDWVSAVIIGFFILFFLPFILIFGSMLLLGLIGILMESLLRLGVPAPLSLILAFSAVGAAGFFILGKLFKGWSSSSSDTSERPWRLSHRDEEPRSAGEELWYKWEREMQGKIIRLGYQEERYQDS